MIRVLLIAGHSHSGSTLPEMMLSAHPRVCGVGKTGAAYRNLQPEGPP